jgi:2-amino-4-hydroxy-6-hydroxymethyldihydropteridine diphosphokinase
MHRVFFGLGTNLGDKTKNLELALESISNKIGEIRMLSSVYETKAWGVQNQDNYYNLVLEVYTEIYPFALIREILEIESLLGRVREKKWDSRIIDIDILFFENYIINNDHLQLPHPFIEKRNFVLEPLNEIVSNFIHPKLRNTIWELKAACLDKNWIKKLDIKLQPELL